MSEIIASPYQEEIKKIRLLLILEVEPFSGKFTQVQLTRKQFKMISDTLANTFPQCEHGHVNLTSSKDTVDGIPEHWADFYEDYEDKDLPKT